MTTVDANFSTANSPSLARVVWRSNEKLGHAGMALDEDKLHEKLASGRYGGIPLDGPYVAALSGLLTRLAWTFDARELASAMFHFPEKFDLLELKVVLYRLGYEAVEQARKGCDLQSLPNTALILTADRRLCLIQEATEKERQLIDLDTREIIAIKPKSNYECLLFDIVDKAEHRRATRSWLSDTWVRFQPEIRLLLGLMLASNVIVILASLSTIKIFDTVLPSRALDTLLGIMIGLAGLILLEFRIRQIRAHLVARVAGRIEYLLGTALFSKLISMPLSMLTANSINDQVGRLKQFETVRDFFNGPVVAVVFELPFAFLLLGIIFYIDTTLGFLSLALMCVYFLITAIMFPKLKRANKQMAAAQQDHAKFLLETLEHREQIFRMGIGDIWQNRLRPKTRRLVTARSKLELVTRVFSTIAGSTTPLGASTTIFVGAGMVIEGHITGGQLIGVTMLSSRLFAPIQQTAICLVRGPELANLFRQIDAMMRIETEAAQERVELTRKIEPSVVFEGVSMRYPKAQNTAISGVTLKVQVGEIVAITGHSGAGKSSLLRLILALYPIQLGSIQLGGININQLNRSEISRNVAYVGDSPTLIHGTISQNLLLSTPDISHDDLIRVTTELGIRDWIENLPQGFQTRLNHEQMTHIPPGVKTLLSVAQALLRDPPILLLDEALSGLPPENETLLLSALMKRRGRKTTLVVTQRPSHHRKFDRVINMVNGRIETN